MVNVFIFMLVCFSVVVVVRIFIWLGLYGVIVMLIVLSFNGWYSGIRLFVCFVVVMLVIWVVVMMLFLVVVLLEIIFKVDGFMIMSFDVLVIFKVMGFLDILIICVVLCLLICVSVSVWLIIVLVC